jgi:hypothetical protein
MGLATKLAGVLSKMLKRTSLIISQNIPMDMPLAFDCGRGPYSRWPLVAKAKGTVLIFLAAQNMWKNGGRNRDGFWQTWLCVPAVLDWRGPRPRIDCWKTTPWAMLIRLRTKYQLDEKRCLPRQISACRNPISFARPFHGRPHQLRSCTKACQSNPLSFRAHVGIKINRSAQSLGLGQQTIGLFPDVCTPTS